MELRLNIDIFCKVNFARRDVNLDISSGFEFEVLPFRKFNNKLFDEGCHILVADNFTLPFLYTQYLFRYLNFHILLNLYLATQTPLCLLLFAGEEAHLCREDLSATFGYTALAHSAGSAATAGRWKEYFFVTQCAEKRRAG
ncbi:hypothetical protein DSECCO2_643660 [anaerobic digester metagenome]